MKKPCFNKILLGMVATLCLALSPSQSARGQVILSEVLTNPPRPDDGQEWIELFNAGEVDVDLNGWSLGWGGASYASSGVDLTGIIAAGETFVVGGPASTSTNANPIYDQVVNFSGDIQNAGPDADGVALFNVTESMVTSSTVPVDALVYGVTNSSMLVDEAGVVNHPEVPQPGQGDAMVRVDLAGNWELSDTPSPNFTPLSPVPMLRLSEVMYDPSTADAGEEWVEIINLDTKAVNLGNWSFAWGGSDWGIAQMQLSGSILPGQVMVIGGPVSSSDNANPVFDLVMQFDPGLQNAAGAADGVGLFRMPATAIVSNSVPVDAVIYGDANDSNLIDETGVANAPDVASAPNGSSLERLSDGSWIVQATATPNVSELGGSKTLPAGDTLDIITLAYSGTNEVTLDLDLDQTVDVLVCYATDLQNPVWVEVTTAQLTPVASTIVLDISSLAADQIGYLAVISYLP